MNWLDKLKGKMGRPDGTGERKLDSSRTPGAVAAEAIGAQDASGSRQHGGGTVVRGDGDRSESAPGPAAGDWAPRQEVLDDFVVEGTLGEGGMGTVYLVRSRTNGLPFAVKRAKGIEGEDQKRFLAELQTWIDLPEHPNLVQCRFFRTMDDEILIFAEYVEGGSLSDWIDSRRLYEGGPRQALERMLDVAIQFAWGLSCLHELGLVHQDVKPGNVLMSMDGGTSLQGVKPRVTDYGLTRSRAAGGEAASADPNRSVLVSLVGGSPAYWSPEQAAGWPLSNKTDIWSWGISVLEMFTGGVTWLSGLAADKILEEHLRNGACDQAIPFIPGRLVDLLRECFRQEPSGRLVSLSEAVNQLKATYQESVDRDYNRTLQGIERAVSPQTGIKERREPTGVAWTDPREWLERALRAAGRDPAEAVAMLGQRGATRRGELVAEVAVYNEAKRLYVRLVREGRKELESDLAALCLEKALVHRTTADEQGAIQEYDHAIAIRERLVNQEGRRELANELATAYLSKAVSVSALGDHRSAVVLQDQAIAIWERLVNQEGHRELANKLAHVYMNKANAVQALGDHHSAVTLYDQAIAIRERLVNQDGCRELANDLAMAYMNKAISVSALGDHRSAVALYNRVVAIRERLVNQEGRRELANDLAVIYVNKAIAVRALGGNRGAVALYDQAIAIRERLVNQEGRRELANDLANVYLNKAVAVRALGDNHGAVALQDQAIAIWERLVNQEGRRELANDLANVYLNKAVAVSALGDNHGAVALQDQAIAIWERLVNQEGRRELAYNLAMAYMNKAIVMEALGDNRNAVALYDQAIAIRERLVNQEGRLELSGELAKTKAYRGERLLVLGERAGGLEEMRSAQRILEAEIARTGRADLKQVLTWVQQQLTKHSA